MELVTQEDIAGCGPACLAIVSGLTYKQARRLLLSDRRIDRDRFTGRQSRRRRKRKGTSNEMMMRALKRLGYDCFKTRDFRYLLEASKYRAIIVSFEILPALGKQRNSGRGYKHFVVWDPMRGMFLDPGAPKYYEHLPTWRYLEGLRGGSGLIVIK